MPTVVNFYWFCLPIKFIILMCNLKIHMCTRSINRMNMHQSQHYQTGSSPPFYQTNGRSIRIHSRLVKCTERLIILAFQCTKLTCNIYSECQRLPDMATQLCIGGRGGTLSSMFQLAITCIVEITCNLHCIHRIRQTVLIQNVVQDDTRNMPLMFVCKCHGPQPCTTYTIFLYRDFQLKDIFNSISLKIIG